MGHQMATQMAHTKARGRSLRGGQQKSEEELQEQWRSWDGWLSVCVSAIYVLSFFRNSHGKAETDGTHDITVAKRKTLFDDRPVEINELTYVIKQDLSSLNSQISSLQSLSKLQQSQVSRRGAEQEGEHNKNVRWFLRASPVLRC